MSRARAIDTADIDRAQAVSIADIALERGFVFDRAGNHVGPCPHCGGRDRFSIFPVPSAFSEGRRRERDMIQIFSDRAAVVAIAIRQDAWFVWNNAAPSEHTRVVWIPPGLKPKRNWEDQ